MRVSEVEQTTVLKDRISGKLRADIERFLCWEEIKSAKSKATFQCRPDLFY